jgi:hypothetical protein
MRCARCTGCDGGGSGAWSEAEATRIEKRDHSEAVGRLDEVALIPMQRTRVCVRVRDVYPIGRESTPVMR